MSPASPIPQEDSFDLLTSNESCKLSGITAGRAKPPKRRPPSSHFLKENIPDIIDIQVEEDEPDEEVKVEEKMETPSSPVIARPSSLSANIGRPKSMMSPGSMGMGPMPMFDVSQVKLRKTKVSETKQCSLPDNPSNKPSWMDELKKNQVNNRRSLGTFLEKQAPKQSENKDHVSNNHQILSARKEINLKSNNNNEDKIDKNQINNTEISSLRESLVKLRSEMRDQLSELKKDLEREKSEREALQKEVSELRKKIKN